MDKDNVCPLAAKKRVQNSDIWCGSLWLGLYCGVDIAYKASVTGVAAMVAGRIVNFEKLVLLNKF